MCAGCQDKYAGRHADTHQAMRLSLMGRKEEESFERQGWRGVQKKRTASRGGMWSASRFLLEARGF